MYRFNQAVKNPIHLPIHIAVNFFKRCVFIEKEKNETGQLIAELIKTEIHKIALGDRLVIRINLTDSPRETDFIKVNLFSFKNLSPESINNFKAVNLQVNFPIFEEKFPRRGLFNLYKKITLVENLFVEELHFNIKTGLRNISNEMFVLSMIQNELRVKKAAAKTQILVKGAFFFSVLLFYQSLLINFFIFNWFSSRKYE